MTKIIFENAYYIVIAIVSFWLGFSTADGKIEETTIKVNKNIVIEERIVETPGGRKVTTRVIKDLSSSSSIRIQKPVGKNWIIGVSTPVGAIFRSKIVSTLTIDRRVFSDVYMGLYGRTDGEIGLSLKYLF